MMMSELYIAMRDDGVRDDGVRDDGVRDDGVRDDGVSMYVCSVLEKGMIGYLIVLKVDTAFEGWGGLNSL